VSCQGSARSGTALCPARQRQDRDGFVSCQATPGQRTVLCPARQRQDSGQFCALPGSARSGDVLCPARQRQVRGRSMSCQAAPGQRTVLCPARQRQVRDGFMCPTRVAPGQVTALCPARAAPGQGTVLCPARTTDSSVSWPAGIYQDKNGSMASRTPPGQVIGSLPCLAYFSHTFPTTSFSKFNVFMNPCFFHSLRKLRRYLHDVPFGIGYPVWLSFRVFTSFHLQS
jgi:hypothetical protein